MSLSPDRKVAGVLAPLFAVRGKMDCGIGDTSSLRELVDWAADQGLGFVQMLPVNETGNDHSPYNLISSMALEPSTISCNPEDFPETTPEEYSELLAFARTLPPETVHYTAIKPRKKAILQAACERFFSSRKRTARRQSFEDFVDLEAEWLDAYTLHHALQDWNRADEILDHWPEEHRNREKAEEWIETLTKNDLDRLDSLRRFHAFVQWVAHTQWQNVRNYAASREIALIGDVPVGVSIYSVDVWDQPHLFDLKRSCGAPPERAFQADPFTMQWGQNWGFPLYDWFAMSHDNFRWWRRRLQSLKSIFDLLRVDHALGFFRIYSFPWRPERNGEFLGISDEEAMEKTGGLLPGFVPNDDDTPEHREANRLHGETLLGILAEETGAHGLIAEDLGEVAPYVRPTLAKMELPGFKIPQWETEPDGTLTPGHEYPRLSITTYSTHDHPPVREIWNALWTESQGSDPQKADHALRELRNLVGFCGGGDVALGEYSSKIQGMLLRGLWKSNSWLAAATINDLLGTSTRFNTPGTAGGQNWSERIPPAIQHWATEFGPAILSWKTDVRSLRPN